MPPMFWKMGGGGGGGAYPDPGGAGYRRDLRDRGPGPAVLAFVFGHADSEAMRSLDMRGEYFDRRTGDLWNLYFPGYETERRPGAQSVGRRFTRGWYFYPEAFDRRRREISRLSDERWEYSGGVDLVLVNVVVGRDRTVQIDWTSIFSTNLAEQHGASDRPTLATAIERITHDLESGAEDAAYGLREPHDREPRTGVRDVVVQVLTEIAVQLASRGAGLR
jgi:hypothetical protein